MTLQEQANKLFGNNQVIKDFWMNLRYGSMEEVAVLLNDQKGFDVYMTRFKRAENTNKATQLVNNQVAKYKAWLVKVYGV
jgi:hypothetical protein